jgi:hypothetical protein
MKPFAACGFAFLVVSGPAWAADSQPPEHLIPATAQIYLRWDGVAAHREQYSRTAIGQLLGHDLAPLRKELTEFYPRLLRSELTERKLLDGLPPERLAKIHAAVAESGKLLDVIAEHGIVVSADVGVPNPFQVGVGAVQMALGKQPAANPVMPRVQVMLIVPDAAADSGPILNTLRLFDTEKSNTVKDETIAGRKTIHVISEGVHVTGWVEGTHVVVAVSTEPPAVVMSKIDGSGPWLDSHPLYQRLQANDDFHTDLRAFADMKSIVGLIQGVATLADAAAAKKLDATGLTGINSIVFRGGFDGPTLKQVIEVDAPGPRKGILRLVGGKPVTLDQLPPLPPDVNRWSAHRLDPNAVYEVATQIYDLLHPPDPSEGETDTAAQRLDKAAGVEMKADILPYLKDTVVAYSAPSEGFFAFGQVIAIEVSDPDKLLPALDQIMQTQAGGNVRVRKRPIADGEVREIYVRNKPGFFFTPTYAVYKNWLVISMFPQAVQSFVMRAGGGAKVWEPDESVKTNIAAMPKTATGLAFSDLRPSLSQGLAFAPLIVAQLQAFGNGGALEVGTLPSASLVNQRLTPTVTTLSDDGKTLRWESRGALLLPGDFLGIDPLLLIFGALIVN